MTQNNAITIQWVSHAADIPAELWQHSFPPDVEGRWWYETLEKSHLEDQFEFAYALINSNGRPSGIAPTFIMNVPMELVAPPCIAKLLRVFPPLRYQRTLFVGSPCSDEGTIGLLPGFSLSDAVPVLQDALAARAKEKKTNMLVWKDFPQAARPALNALCRGRGMFHMVSFPGTLVHLPPGGFEDYLKTLKSHHRYLLKKKLKLSCVAGALIAEVVRQPDEKTLQELFGLFWQTYEKGKTKFEKLNMEFFRQIARQPQSYFIILRHESTGIPAAFMLCFLAGEKAINKFIGMDYSLDPELHLYFRLWEQFVLWAYSAGAWQLQSGQTGYRAKREVGHQLVELDCYCRHRNPLLHRLYAMVAKGITWNSLDPDLPKSET